ncbi:MAG: hypothetical protein ACLFVJ_07150 [Persicimonas sp.]
MADEKTSQSQNGFGFFQKAIDSHIDRLDSFYKQANELQKKSFEQTDQALENAATLSRASMKYAQELTQEFWNIGLESARRGTEFFDRKA